MCVNLRAILVAGLGGVLLAVFTSPSVSAVPAAPLPVATRQLTLPAPKAQRARSLVLVLADNAGAETTDFLIPYAVLKDSGVADVKSVSTAPGTIQLFRAVKIVADQTISHFDAMTPAGADVVIVPAQLDPKSPVLASWLRNQYRRGATIVSICEGARVLANAGLLRGKRATTHFMAMDDLKKAYPETVWVRDRRYVQDGRIISTTGVSASIPVSLALVEALGGHAKALAAAQRIGANGWGSAHHTADFRATLSDYAYAFSAMAAFWRHETLEIPINNGVDEIALGLKADSWERSFRTTVMTTHVGRTPIKSKHGLTIIPDAEPQGGSNLVPTHFGSSVAQLDAALADMEVRYGPRAARVARLGMEYDLTTSVRSP